MLGRYVPTAVRCGLLFYLIVHSTLVGVEIFVAPHGDDTAVGSFEKPFRTLGRARDALRQRRFASETCQVWLRGGTYFQVEPLVLGPMDSGTPESPVRWAAWKNERAILSLGIRVGGWTPGTGGFWRAQVSGIRSNLTLEAFFVNGARAVRARTPNAVRRIPLVENRPLVETVGVDTGYTYVDFKGGYGKDPATGALVDLSFQSFTPLDRRLIPALATLEPPALSEVVACFVKPEGWQSARIRVARVEPGHDLIVLQGIANRRADQHAELFRGYPFYLEGFPDALDEPGEWYLDRSRGVLSYLARPGDNPETAEAFLSASGQHLVISGKGDEPVHDLVFSNLIFRHAAFATPREMVGFHGEQCAPFLEAAIQVDGARGVWFENCEISQTGACFALHFGRKCNQCGVRRTLFSDLGGGGYISTTTFGCQIPRSLLGNQANWLWRIAFYGEGDGSFIMPPQFCFITPKVAELCTIPSMTFITSGYRPVGIGIMNRPPFAITSLPGIVSRISGKGSFSITVRSILWGAPLPLESSAIT